MNEETYAKRMVERCSEMIVNALQNLSIEDINMYQLGYEKGRAKAIDEFVKAFLDKENQSNYIQLNHHTQSWNGYAKNIAEQLKEQENGV